MISTSQFSIGQSLIVEGELMVILGSQWVKPGKGGAFIKTKLRRFRDGAILERTFKSGEKFQEAFIEKRALQYLYREGDTLHLMDMASYDQLEIKADQMGPAVGFLKENAELEGQFHNDRLIGLQPPMFVEVHVQATEPGVRGATSKASTKPATLETGATIMVPLFVDNGDLIRIDTRTSSYISRV